MRVGDIAEPDATGHDDPDIWAFEPVYCGGGSRRLYSGGLFSFETLAHDAIGAIYLHSRGEIAARGGGGAGGAGGGDGCDGGATAVAVSTGAVAKYWVCATGGGTAAAEGL